MRTLPFLLSISVLTVVLAEAGARWGLGLGTPPLSVEHPTIDYMFAPNQDVNRFGNRQVFNSFGMRSEPLDDVGERQLILVFGDSVLNGGNLTDHKELATTLATDDDTFFGNVSAGSWGPGNYRAWIDEFGLLGADDVVFVLRDHDLNDQPEFKPLNPNTHPTERPLFALGELVTRYLPRYLPDEIASVFALETPDSRDHPVTMNRPTGIEDMQDIFARLAANGVSSCILFHPTQSELDGEDRTGTAVFQELADSWDIPSIDLASAYLERGNPSQFYRENDNIHINAAGQQVLAAELSRCHAQAQVPTVPYKR